MKVMYVGMYAFMGTSAVEKLEQMFSDMQKDRLTFGNKSTFKNYDIEFERVCFGYTDQMVLEDVSFTLKEGRSYALVGSSGGGKSTIAKLISGFTKWMEDRSRLGRAHQSLYRGRLNPQYRLCVPECPFVSHQYLRECPSGEPRRSKNGGHGRLHQAGCDSILDKFKDRENTVIGSKGVYLSGGEKQRIAIARAMLKNANCDP
ncbi:MAG: ATP-binding cassette domain-containing protein [Enterocloster clostridioformis]